MTPLFFKNFSSWDEKIMIIYKIQSLEYLVLLGYLKPNINWKESWFSNFEPSKDGDNFCQINHCNDMVQNFVHFYLWPWTWQVKWGLLYIIVESEVKIVRNLWFSCNFSVLGKPGHRKEPVRTGSQRHLSWIPIAT